MKTQEDMTTQLTRVFSQERLNGYCQRVDSTNQRTVYSRYLWNVMLSESLYSSLHVLEISLRNSINEAASCHFNQKDWYDNLSIINFPNEIKALKKSKNILHRQGKQSEPGRVIAELNLGFWTSLLDKRYEQVLWPRLLQAAFPNMPRRRRTRRILSRRFQKIRQLRNRIFHYEPIWHWRDLPQQHQDILEAITWIEPLSRDLVVAIDRFPEAYATGLETSSSVISSIAGTA